MLEDDNLTDIRIMKCFSVEKKMTVNIPSCIPRVLVFFYRASVGLSEMEMFSIFICFLKVHSDNECNLNFFVYSSRDTDALVGNTTRIVGKGILP